MACRASLEHRKDLGEIDLRGRLAEVVPHRGADLVAPRQERLARGGRIFAIRSRRRRVAATRGAGSLLELRSDAARARRASSRLVQLRRWSRPSILRPTGRLTSATFGEVRCSTNWPADVLAPEDVDLVARSRCRRRSDHLPLPALEPTCSDIRTDVAALQHAFADVWRVRRASPSR